MMRTGGALALPFSVEAFENYNYLSLSARICANFLWEDGTIHDYFSLGAGHGLVGLAVIVMKDFSFEASHGDA